MNVSKLQRTAVFAVFGLLIVTAQEAQASRGWRHHGLSWHASWGWAPGVWAGYGYDSYPSPVAGALDLDVEPETVEVYVDGQRVGTADDFDGFPSYLWLEKGTYDVVFYQEGYVTLARQYSVYPGYVIDVEDQLQSGESVRPEDLVSRSTERRDARLRRDAERQAEADSRADDSVQPPLDDDWRSRRPGSRTTHQPNVLPSVAEPAPPPVDRRGKATDAGRVTLRVEPADASIYLDGRFVGTGAELAAAALTVEEGEHLLQAVRPGRASQQLRFEIEDGEAIELELDLPALEGSADDD